jgi:phosphoserine phosphatase RsbU/P
VDKCPDPASLLFQMNNKMCAFLPTEQFVTVFYAILDPPTGRLIYSSAGHNPPLKADLDTHRCVFLTNCEGFPVKLLGPGMVYENHEIQLAPSQHLILYTDGLTEAFNENGDPFNSERMTQSIRHAATSTPQGLIDTLLHDLQLFVQDHPLDDDLSLFVISRNSMEA